MNVDGPRTPYYWLDSVAQWRGTWTGIEQNPTDGSLSIEPLPAPSKQLFVALGTAGQCVGENPINCPVAVAADPCHGIFVLDSTTGRIFNGDVDGASAHELAAVGGRGSGPRQFAGARGIAILSDGSFAVLDAKLKRVSVFTPDPFALTAVITLASNSQPVGIAAGSHDLLLIAEAAQKTILVFDREGHPRKSIGENQLTSPTAVAASRKVIAVLDGSSIALFDSNGELTRIALPVGFRYESLAFDEYGALYTGALPLKGAEGSILRIAIENATPVIAGFGAMGLEGRVIGLANLAGKGLVAIIYNATARTSSIWLIDTRGSSAAQGVFTSNPLDSRIDRCSWHRIVCEGSVPPGTSITLETVTAAKACDLDWAAAAPRVLTVSGDDAAKLTDPDFLVQSGPGRFLQFRLTLRSSVPASPIITGIRVEFPRQSYLQYLPAVLQEDPESRFFLDRFLSLFQTYFDGQDDRIDGLSTLFNPAASPSQYLGWLAAIVAQPLDPAWTIDKRRQMLAGLFHYDPVKNFVTGRYPSRGTPAQVAQDIADYSGVESVGILEHYKIRTWLNDSGKLPLDGTSRLWSRDIYQRLQVAVYSQLGYFRLLDQPEPALEPLAWGAHKFSVFFRADAYTLGATRDKVALAVEMAKPAHTQAMLCPVLPRFRVEYQSTIGIDTVLAGVDEMILGTLGTLDYDAVLAKPAGIRSPAAQGMETAPRAEITTTLL
jgi:hypothetical protein